MTNIAGERTVGEPADEIRPTTQRKVWVTPTVIVSSIVRDTAKTPSTFEAHLLGTTTQS